MKKNTRRLKVVVIAAAVAFGGWMIASGNVASSQSKDDLFRMPPNELPSDEQMALLGDLIFDDEDLSINRNQSCATCHNEDWGFTGPDSAINASGSVYEGSIPGRFGARKPPSSGYATISPIFSLSTRGEGLFEGGNFWDGRATGEVLGNPASDQAQGPFLNPREQGLRDAACVVYRVGESDYGDLYREVWGNTIDEIVFPGDIETLCAAVGGPIAAIDPTSRAKVAGEFEKIALAIAVYEQSKNTYSSKFDASKMGKYKFTKLEQEGFSLFKGKAKCDKCHVSRGRAPAFTDFTFDNLGTPANPDNPVYSEDAGFVDLGLGGFLATRLEWDVFADLEKGKFKVPTLRNVDRRPNPGDVKAYMHNGVFKSLEEVVHFYNTRDVLPYCGMMDTRSDWGVTCWPAPEYPYNVNDDELGNLGLSADEEAAIVAFLKTLSDGFLD